MSILESIKKEVAELQRTRDELKVRAALGKAEAKDVWDRLESQVWPDVERKLQTLERHAGSAADDVASATKNLIEEIRTGYKKLRSKE
jgi:hypothetical protein